MFLYLYLQPLVVGHVLKRDAQAQRRTVVVEQGHEMHVEILPPTFRLGPFHIEEMVGSTLGVNLLNARAQLYWSVGELQLIKGTAHILRDDIKGGPRLLVDQREFPLQIEHHLGHRSSIKSRLAQADMSGQVIPELQTPRLRHQEEPVAQGRLGHLSKDTVLQVQGGEEVGAGEHHLRFSQEKTPQVTEGEMEAGQDARLRLSVEIHQRIATHQEV